MCEFHQLYLGPEGYIVVCKHCGYFQLCYGRLVLDLSKHDFGVLRMLIKKKLNAEYDYPDEELKQIIIPTPHSGVNLLLSMAELRQFDEILEEAENELDALSLLSLFQS